jgi:hypothetical protein
MTIFRVFVSESATVSSRMLIVVYLLDPSVK